MRKPATIILFAWGLVYGPFCAPLHASWISVLTGSAGATPTEHLWTTPILQQQATNNDFYNIGEVFSSNADQYIQNTDSARLITKVRLKLQETEGADQTVTMQLRSAVNGGGTLYATATGTLHASQTEWVDFVVSYTMGASTNFYINVSIPGVGGRARMLLGNIAGGTYYDGTTYKAYNNGSDDTNYDLCFEIYITS